MSKSREWVAGEVGLWLDNDERLHFICVHKARKSRSKADLAKRIRNYVLYRYETWRERFGEVTLTDVRSLRLVEWGEIAEQFMDEAPWGKEKQ